MKGQFFLKGFSSFFSTTLREECSLLRFSKRDILFVIGSLEEEEGFGALHILGMSLILKPI